MAMLAACGLDRLGLAAEIGARLEPEEMLPEAAQGALALQVRVGEEALVDRADHAETRRRVEPERQCVAAIGGGCLAPVAAHLAKGVSAARMGKPIDNYLRPRSLKPERTARRGWTGLVLKVDRFGNLITNFLADEFPRALQEPFEMAVGLRQVNRLAPNYEQFGPGEVFVIVGSSGYLEVSAGQASAAKILGVAAGAPVELTIF